MSRDIARPPLPSEVTQVSRRGFLGRAIAAAAAVAHIPILGTGKTAEASRKIARDEVAEDLLLRIENIEPGSNVGIWKSEAVGTLSPDDELFLDRVHEDHLEIAVPPELAGEPIIVRIRQVGWLPMEVPASLSGDGLTMVIQQIPDQIFMPLP